MQTSTAVILAVYDPNPSELKTPPEIAPGIMRVGWISFIIQGYGSRRGGGLHHYSPSK